MLQTKQQTDAEDFIERLGAVVPSVTNWQVCLLPLFATVVVIYIVVISDFSKVLKVIFMFTTATYCVFIGVSDLVWIIC